MSDTNSPLDLPLRISTSRGHRGRVNNGSWSWESLVDRLSVAEVSRETLETYLALPKEQRLSLKNVGYYVPGHFRDGVRRTANLISRCLVSLDLDDIPRELYFALLGESSPIRHLEYLVHSTRSHRCPDHIRIRLLLPLRREIEPAQYEPVARMVASWVNPDMHHVDRVSFVAAQPMFWPSRCSDGEYVFHRNEGRVLDPDDALLEYLVWFDPDEWPKRADEHVHRNAGESVKREDPRRRITAPVVAAFCRAYDVHEAIATFLPDVYSEAAGHADDRYTYVRGSSAAGARVYDDGLYLHSEHDTDPARGQHHAFDLVRIHLFGELDKGVDFTVTPLASWPSYKAMRELAESDEAVKAHLDEVEREAFAQRSQAVIDLFDDLGGDDEEEHLDELGGFEIPKSERPKPPQNADDLLEMLTERMNKAPSIADLDKIASKVQGLPYADFGARYRDRLVGIYMSRLKVLSDGRFSMSRPDAKKQLKPSEATCREALRREGQPGYFDDWVWLSMEDRWLNLRTGEKVTERGFNAKYDARCIEDYPSEKTGLPSIHASELALNVYELPKPYREMYWPGRGALFTHEQVDYANSYRDTGCQPDGYEGWRGVKLLLMWLMIAFPNRRHRRMILDFMAHCVQNPERKLKYALMLKGVRQDGKTMLAEILRIAVGDSNFQVIQSHQLGARFNGWLAGSTVVVVEEVKQHGVDAHDSLNNIKPAITNRTVAVERKGKDSVVEHNFANFLLTSNYDDAMPLSDGENRYLAIFTRFRSEAELAEVREPWKAKHGFDILEAIYDEMERHPYQFRRFLENYTPSEFYQPNARAPETEFLREMIEGGKSEARQTLEDLLDDEKEPLITPELIVSSRVKQAFEARGLRIYGRGFGALLNEIGASRVGRHRFPTGRSWVWSFDPEMRGAGDALSVKGQEAVEAAWATWAAQDDFEAGNYVGPDTLMGGRPPVH